MDAKAWAAAVPEALKKAKRWIAWGDDPDSGRPKCPLMLRARSRRASTRKPTTWADYQVALAYLVKYGAEPATGVGYVFCAADGLVYVDLDDCLDEHGMLREWAAPFVEPFQGRAYMERSPSGRGLHIIGRGKLPGDASGGKRDYPEHASGYAGKTPEVALFADGKYTTVTGDVWNGQRVLGDVTDAVAFAWDLAAIHATGVDVSAGPAPAPEELPEPDRKALGKGLVDQLESCEIESAEDRSSARFAFYADCVKRGLMPEEIFAAVTSGEWQWWEASGAAEKGRHHTWADIVRACAKVAEGKAEFEALEERQAEAGEERAAMWRRLGVPVIVTQTQGGPEYRVPYGLEPLVKLLMGHEAFAGKLRFNELTSEVELEGRALRHLSGVAGKLRDLLAWDREPSVESVLQAAEEVAHERRYHPVAEWLRGLEWDGKGRIGDWLARAGCEDTHACHQLGRKWIVSLVARALSPGCKVDTVLILEGDQGERKSGLFRALAGEDWFTDSRVTYDKDGLMILTGHWLVELAELSTLKKAENEATKAFLSAQRDTFRPPYGRVTITKPRHFLCVGSTNDEQYLSDPTGARRYWPIRVARRLDVALVHAEREQLLAEAVAAFQAGEPWWYDVQPAWLSERQGERQQVDELGGLIEAFAQAQKPQRFGFAEFAAANGFRVEDRSLATRFGAWLKLAGYRKARVTQGAGRPWVYWHSSWPQLVGGAQPSENVGLDSEVGQAKNISEIA